MYAAIMYVQLCDSIDLNFWKNDKTLSVYSVIRSVLYFYATLKYTRSYISYLPCCSMAYWCDIEGE